MRWGLLQYSHVTTVSTAYLIKIHKIITAFNRYYPNNVSEEENAEPIFPKMENQYVSNPNLDKKFLISVSNNYPISYNNLRSFSSNPFTKCLF